MDDAARDALLQEVLGYEDRRRAAIVARDFGELDRLLSPDLAYVHSNGMVDTKDDYVALVKAHTFNSIDHDLIRTLVHSDVAVLTAITTIDARADSDGTVLAGKIRSVNIWERTDDGAWQQVHWQASKAAVET